MAVLKEGSKMGPTNIAEQTLEMFIFLDYDVPNPEWS